MKIHSSILYFLALLISVIFLTLESNAEQQVNPKVIEQVRFMLNAKGLNEEEVKSRLKTKGIDVEKMSQEELIKNKSIIEQTVSEMEAEKSNKKQETTGKVNPKAEEILVNKNNPVMEERKSDTLPPVRSEPNQPTSGVYGHQIFKNNSIQVYRVSKDAVPPDSYILAPGDKINVLIFGKSQADLQYEVNIGGYIQPTLMPKIFISGLTLAQARELISNRFSTYYAFNKDQFALTLNTSRTLNVNIFGEVEKAGSYTTSALNTAINILSVSGGPTEIGSVRNIQIIRGKTKKILDIYAFMRNPILQFNFYMQDNDILYIPPADKIVTVEGAINRAMRYELKPEEGIKELIDFAGGLKTNAFTELLQIERFEDNHTVLKDYSLNDIMHDKIIPALKNGDIIRLKDINSPLKNFVKITGSVQYPGSYDLNTTNHVKTLLEKAKLMPEAKTDQAFIIRKRMDLTNEVIAVSLANIISGKEKDMEFLKEDELIIYSQARFVDTYSIAVTGEVRNPYRNVFKYDSKLSIKEALDLAGGLKNTAANFAYIYRTPPFQTKKTLYIPIDLNSPQTELLQPGDNLVILDKNNYELESSITISGEVNKTTSLRFDSSLTIKDLLKIAGGIKLSSDINTVQIFRINFNKTQTPTKSLISLQIDKDFNIKLSSENISLQPFDVVVVRRIPEFKMQETVELSGEVKYSGPYIIKNNRYFFSELIKDAGGLTEIADLQNTSLIRSSDSSGILVFSAKDALNHKGSLEYDPILNNGDYVDIPKLYNTIEITTLGTKYLLGRKQNLLQIVFRGNQTANWYINKYAGGFAKKADKRSVHTIAANGLTSRTKHYLFFFNQYPRVNQGDKIVLSLKEEKNIATGTKKEFDWDKFLTRLLAIGTTWALIKTATK